jgi:hypothetical protein
MNIDEKVLMEQQSVLPPVLQLFLNTIFGFLLDRAWQFLIQRFGHRDLSEKSRSIAQAFAKFSIPYLRESGFYIKGIGQLRRTEIHEIESAWSGGINGVLLVGKAGTGKSGIAVALANDIKKEIYQFSLYEQQN